MRKSMFIWGMSLLFPFSSLFSQTSSPVLFHHNSLFFVGKHPASDSYTTLFVKGGMKFEGHSVELIQNGETRLTGDFINDVASGNIFSAESTGTVVFSGTEEQTIRGLANKAYNYIDFPNVEINNSASVRIDADMGIETFHLKLTKGRLVLGSKENETQTTLTETAHLLVKTGGTVTYNRDAESIDDKGIIQVDLAMGDEAPRGRLVGFSPPFKRIYSDYFAFNFLSKPSPAGLFGDQSRLITNLDVPMNAGEGYIIGQDIVEDISFYDNISEHWFGIEYNQRYTQEFSFARDYMPSTFSVHNDAEDRFTGEEINIDDLSIELTQQGFNYVGNPFTTPLDLSGFVESAPEADEWGVSRSANASGEVRNAYYLMSGGSGKYNGTTKKFTFHVSYLLGQAVGGTAKIEANEPMMVAPMQMFIVGKNTNSPSTLIIPASARSHGPASFFKTRSAGNTCVDEALIEVVDEDTDAFDRLCVVFRDNASLRSGDPYDASKLFNHSKGVSQIYTLSSDEKRMTCNVIPPTTSSIPLCLTPASVAKDVTLSAYRLNSLESVDVLLLEDKLTGEIANLLLSPSYRFTTHPDDPDERFVLHFQNDLTTGMDKAAIRPVIVFSKNKQLKMSGLSENDKGSLVTVTDMQGRVLYNGTIADAPVCSIEKTVETGFYIVKITGKYRDVTSKVHVK